MCKPAFDRPAAWSTLEMSSKRPWIGLPMTNRPDQRRLPEGTRIVKDIEEEIAQSGCSGAVFRNDTRMTIK